MPTGEDFVREAGREIGRPYVWGGESPRGFDCSGLVQYSLERLGLRHVPRTSEQQYAWVDRVSAENVEPGDLVFFHFPGEVGAGHVAIFAGRSGRGPNRRSSVIQAPRPGENVQRVPFTPLPAGSHEWGGTILGYGRVPGLSYQHLTLESLWIHAGGPPKVARTMAAIALAESGGRVAAVGGPNTDGSYDYGLWQINSSHDYSRARLLHDAGYNARAAVAVFHSQGLTAWSSYSSGRYKQYLPQADKAEPQGRPPRPGPGGGGNGGSGGGSSSSSAPDTSAEQSAAWGSYVQEADAVPQGAHGNQPVSLHIGPWSVPGTGWVPDWLSPGVPGIPGTGGSWNPLAPFEDAAGAVSDLGTFLKWVAWIFSPRNLLRIVEFLAGAGLMAVAARFALEAGRGSRSSSSSGGPSGTTSRTIRRVVRKTPAGRAYALASARRSGRQAARSSRRLQVSKGQREEEKRARKAAQRQEEARRKPGESRRGARARRKQERGDIPF